MTQRTVRLFTSLGSVGLLAACEAVKSANPLSPSVAGPIPGVVISEPKPLEPGAGWELENASQPVRLLLENASTNGQRPLTYTFQLASDAQFTTLVFSRGGVVPGDNGRTSVQVGDRLPTGRSLFWRARAEDGANTGPYSAAVNFSIITPVVIDVPVPVEPVGGATISSTRPSFRIRNPSSSGPAGQIVLSVQIANDEALGSMVAVYAVPTQGSETQFAPTLELPYDKTFFWRVRAYDSGPSGVNSAWSATQAFRTPSPPPPPPPSPSPSPSPSPGGCGPNSAKHVPPGPLTEDKAREVTNATASEFPCYLAVFSTEAQALDAAETLLRRIIWHLEVYGFQADRQRNPSGLISKDKITILIGGTWRAFDIFTLGYAGVATRMTWGEVFPADHVADSGIPD